MNRRITKTMAEEASAMMKKKAYGRKIENATAKVNAVSLMSARMATAVCMRMMLAVAHLALVARKIII